MSNHKKYIFGPVPSRRLGSSLGVDLVPFKTCSIDCIYCEAKSTNNLTVSRTEYVPIDEVISQLDEALKYSPELDFITFSGAGEPTLNSRIGDVVKFVIDNYPQYKMCLLTNGTLLGLEDVVENLSLLRECDVVIPSLDASNEKEFQKINRPHSDLTLKQLVEDIKDFRIVSKAQMWLELFIVPSVNDSNQSQEKFAQIIAEIKPHKVQLNNLDRPGCVDWIRPASEETIKSFINVIEKVAPVEIIGKFSYRSKKLKFSGSDSEIANEILTMTSRRPYTVADFRFAIDVTDVKLDEILCGLIKGKKLTTRTYNRGVFYLPVDE
ncbi:radical SAM protein [Lentisphaerota bacterium WC36G]|nr:radical SAM protein [Lentisphaerae bacterium WC36]